MRKIKASDLRDRVKFAKRKITLNENGDYEEEWIEQAEYWAMVRSLPSLKHNQQVAWNNIAGQKAGNLYQIIMRKDVIRNALHAGRGEVIWGSKILNILLPFRPFMGGDLAETVLIEYEKEEDNG